MSKVQVTTPPTAPEELSSKLRRHNDLLEAALVVQAVRREHASEREQLRLATDELRRWREGLARR